jgi:hypothetical protein
VAALQVVPDKVYAVGAPDEDDCPTATHEVDEVHEMPTFDMLESEERAEAVHLPAARASTKTPELS